MSTIVGSSNNDFLLGTSSDDQIFDRAGNDNIFAGLENDLIDGGEDNDKLAGNGGNNTFKGSRGNDTIKGDDQSNQLFGRGGDDLIDGRGGDDLIDGGPGNDTLLGGAGNDTFKGSQGNDSINGGDGIDTADYSKLGQTISLLGVGTIDKGKLGKDQVFKVETVIADATVANNTIDASQSLPGVSATADLKAQTISANNVPGLGTLKFNVVNFDNIIGTDTNDSIKGDGQRNQLFGRGGDDLIDGRGGDDLIDGGLGNDTLLGGAGNDTFKGSQGNDSIDGGDGIDTADYSKLGQTITLLGVGTIDKGKLGKDQVFKVETVIADATVANNTIDASQSLPGVSATADLKAQTISANNVPGLGTLKFNVVNFDNIIGTDTNDSIKGDGQSNQLFGRGGDDLIDGRGGDDLIDGGLGNDTLLGGAGNDSITGGQGNDILTGGLGADKFIFNSVKEGLDTIKDYKFGQDDVIQVSKVGFGTSNISDFSYDASSGNLSFLGNQFAILENLSSNLSIQLV